MLQDFLRKLGSITGKTYTKKEFGKMIKEGIAADKSAKTQKVKNSTEAKTKTDSKKESESNSKTDNSKKN